MKVTWDGERYGTYTVGFQRVDAVKLMEYWHTSDWSLNGSELYDPFYEQSFTFWNPIQFKRMLWTSGQYARGQAIPKGGPSVSDVFYAAYYALDQILAIGELEDFQGMGGLRELLPTDDIEALMDEYLPKLPARDGLYFKPFAAGFKPFDDDYVIKDEVIVQLPGGEYISGAGIARGDHIEITNMLSGCNAVNNANRKEE